MSRTAFCFTAALSLQLLVLPASAETLTAIVIDEKPDEFYFGPYLPKTRIVDLDTATGEISNTQRLVGSGPAAFTAFERNSDGVLYGVTKTNQLVALDETTGEGTVIVDLGLPGADSFSVEGLALVPGETESTLFALVSTAPGEVDFEGGPPIDSGEEEVELPFHLLAVVDQETGELTDTGYEIGGDSPFSEGHGIDFHPILGKIVHGFSDFHSLIELIDPTTGEVDPVADLSEFFSPSNFHGIACRADGSTFVIDAGEGGFVFRLDISAADPMADHGQLWESSAEPLYPIEIFEEEEESGGPIGPPYDEDRSPVSSLELTADGWLVLEIGGSLRFLPTDLEALDEESELPAEIQTFVPGLELTALSIAVHPVSGELYALTSPGGDEFDIFAGNNMGINIVDRAAGELFDAGKNEIDLISVVEDPEMLEGPPLSFVIAIAFDTQGNLYGINPYYGLVSIDTESGEISAPEEFVISPHEVFAFHPSENRFFVFTNEERDGFGVVQFSESIEDLGFDGSALELSGDVELVEGVPSAATYWKGRLYFATTDYETFYEGGETEEDISEIFSLSLDGSVLRESSVAHPVIALAPPVLHVVPQALPDVLIGEPGSALVGGDLYTATGAGQAVQIKDKGKKLAGKFVSRIENDGNAPDYFTITSSGGSRSDDIKYFLDGANVSAAMRRGLMTYLPPGGAHSLMVKYERDQGSRWNTVFHVIARTTNATDVGLVYSNLKVKRRIMRNRNRLDPRLTGF